MVERAQREPTMEEIVVALRETRRRAGRVPPLTVVDSQPGGARPAHARGGKAGAARSHGAAADAPDGAASSAEIANLRGSEIERLLAENARLNERIVFLLKVIEHEQARGSVLAARLTATETDRARSSDVRAALEAELRPVLLVLLRLLERQRLGPAAKGNVHEGFAVTRPTTPDATPHDANWVVDLDAQHS